MKTISTLKIGKLTALTCQLVYMVSRKSSGDFCIFFFQLIIEDIFLFLIHWRIINAITRFKALFARELTCSTDICVCIQFKAMNEGRHIIINFTVIVEYPLRYRCVTPGQAIFELYFLYNKSGCYNRFGVRFAWT